MNPAYKMTYEEFCKKEYPESVEIYKRLITPNYYECGIEYTPLRSGFGGSGSGYKTLVLKDCTIYKGEVTSYNLYDKNNPKNEYSCNPENIHKSIKRINENVPYRKCIIDDGSSKCIIVGDREYDITLLYFRNYPDNRVGFRIFVKCKESPVWWEYYNMIGKAEPVLKINKVKKSIMERDEYELFFGVPVRRFKEIVFGNPNIKLPRVQHQIEIDDDVSVEIDNLKSELKKTKEVLEKFKDWYIIELRKNVDNNIKSN